MVRVRKRIVWGLVALLVVSPSLSYAQQGANAAPAKKIDVSYITPDAVLAVVAHPRRVLTAPEMEMFPIEILSAVGKQQLGIDPVESRVGVARRRDPPRRAVAGSAPGLDARSFLHRPAGRAARARRCFGSRSLHTRLPPAARGRHPPAPFPLRDALRFGRPWRKRDPEDGRSLRPCLRAGTPRSSPSGGLFRLSPSGGLFRLSPSGGTWLS